MIAFHDNLPLVAFSQDDTAPFNKSWLVRSLTRAAEIAGYERWWLSEHVAQSVENYLRREYEEPLVNVDDLAKAVRSVLKAIGYEDVGENFAPLPPHRHIYLPDLARQAGAGYELLFFNLLHRSLSEALAHRADYLHIHGLQYSVKILTSAKCWRSGCDRLRNEIVHYVHDDLSQRSLPSDFRLILA